MPVANEENFNELVDVISRINIEWASPILTPLKVYLNDIEKSATPAIYWENILIYVKTRGLLSEFINSAFEHTENKNLEQFVGLDWSAIAETASSSDTNSEIEKNSSDLISTSLSFAALIALVSPIFLTMSQSADLKSVIVFIILITLFGMILGVDKRRIKNKIHTFRDALIVGVAIFFSSICYFIITGMGISGIISTDEGLSLELLLHRIDLLFDFGNMAFYISFCLIFSPILISISSFASEWTTQAVIKAKEISISDLDNFHKKLKIGIAIVTTIVLAFLSFF